ncbi:MAG: metal-dependent hydrolase [Planctomycetota bacterium]
MLQLTWLSHASWLIESGELKILLDPFFSDNPAATDQADDFEDVTHILISHGHFDHVGDAASIAKRTGATLIANFEIAQWFGGKGVETLSPMNIGGTVPLSVGPVGSESSDKEQVEGHVKMVPAIHSSGLPDGSEGGTAAGFCLSVDGRSIYFACDTAFFSDMKFYAHNVDVAILPIGDVFTMGIEDSIHAIRLIEPKVVLPTHYDTWPPIEQDADAWAQRVAKETGSQARVLKIGETWTV